MNESQKRASPIEVDAHGYDRPKVKRTRVALACVRCRSRKQKCDGAQDVCSTCRRLGLECTYKAHLTPRPEQKKMYIAALEDHVASLEHLLAESGVSSVTVDHWKDKRHRIRRDSYATENTQDEGDETLPATTNDPIWNAIVNFDNDSTRLPLGRIFSSRASPSSASDCSADESNSASLLTQLAPPHIASRLLEGWIKHLSTQYPIFLPKRLRELHAGPEDTIQESILHLIYANSGRMLEAIGDSGDFRPEEHYQAGVRKMNVILALRDIRSVQYLLLLALYCMREPRNPSAWTLAGLAVRQCIELGLHRKSKNAEITIEKELNIRIFWSCYYLDRGVSVALGRPPAISDGDIDVEFPLDVDENIEDISVLQKAAECRSQYPASPPTSLTSFIHLLRLRMIESKIEQVIYRLNQKFTATPTIMQTFIEQLTEWRDAIPPEYAKESSQMQSRIDAFMIPYFKCVRLLLYSQLSRPDLNLQYLRMCAEACAGLCGAYKRLNRIRRADCSPLAVQSLFLCGLTLLYCAWLAPPGVLDVMHAIADCNLMLYVMAERSPAAQKYCDIFERIKMNVVDGIERGSNASSRSSGILDAEITERCRALDNGLLDTVRTDYTQIISDLAKGTERSGTSEEKCNPSETTNALQLGALGTSGTASHQWGTSPPAMIDYGIGHTFGTFVDAAFMFNLEDFNGFDDITDLQVPGTGHNH